MICPVLPLIVLGVPLCSCCDDCSDDLLDTTALRNLTYVLILHPIGRYPSLDLSFTPSVNIYTRLTGAGLAFVAFLFGLCGSVRYSRIGTVVMSIIAGIAVIITLVAFIVDMILFEIIRSRIRSDTDGNKAKLGNAIWLTLAALIALMLGTCTAACGSFGRYRHHRRTERV